MIKEKSYSKYIFLILALLSICSIWNIYHDTGLSIIKKTIFMCLNFTYLFFVAEYIETMIYRNILVHMFHYKILFHSSVYKIYIIFLPVISMLIYAFAWILYLSDSIFEIQIVGNIILMSESCILYSVLGKRNIIYANKDNLAVNFRLIPYNSINTYELSEKKRTGLDVNQIRIRLSGGDTITLTVEKNYLKELINNLSESKNNIN